jgi:hypothetical protein
MTTEDSIRKKTNAFRINETAFERKRRWVGSKKVRNARYVGVMECREFENLWQTV